MIIGKKLGPKKDFLLHEESLLGRNWVKRKNFLFHEESLYRERIGSKRRVSSSMKNLYIGKELGAKEGFPLL